MPFFRWQSCHRPHDPCTLFPAQAIPDYEKISGIVYTLHREATTSNYGFIHDLPAANPPAEYRCEEKDEEKYIHPKSPVQICSSPGRETETMLDMFSETAGATGLVMFEAPDEKAVINMVLKREDRLETETLVAVPADASSPAGPA
jgi:hypothetical protein